MAYAAYNYTITDESGNVVTGCSIEVRREIDNVLVPLYSDRDGALAISNPFTDSTGTGRFHAAGNAYKITASKTGFSRSFRFVAIGLAGETDFTFTTFSGIWDAATTYPLGAYVIYNDVGIFLSTADDNLNNAPDSATPGSTADWVYYPGVVGPEGEAGLIGTWEGPWVTGTVYSINDAVSQGGSSYICIVSHTSGTFSTDLAAAKWEIVAQKGDTGAAGIDGKLSGTEVVKTAAYTALAADVGKTIILDKATADTLSFEAAATLGTSWMAIIKNIGAGTWTLDPDGAETIDGAATATIRQGQSMVVSSNGTALRSLFLSSTGREALTAARTYYVRTDGSNSNNGLANTSGGAFLTLQYAYNIITSSLDLSGQAVTVQVADGTYTAGLAITQPWTGGGSVTFTGNTSTPANCIISTTSAACLSNSATLPGNFTVQGFKMQTTTGGSGIVNSGVGKIQFGQFDFGAVPAGSYHVFANNKAASIDAIAGYTVSGNASAHLLAIAGVVTTNALCTLSGTPAFGSAFAIASRQGLILCNGMTFSGSATGTRYLADIGGGIFTNGGGASFLPGDSAGSATSPGWYN